MGPISRNLFAPAAWLRSRSRTRYRPGRAGADRGGRGGGRLVAPPCAASRQPMAAMAWTNVFDGRMTAEALAGSGW